MVESLHKFDKEPHERILRRCLCKPGKSAWNNHWNKHRRNPTKNLVKNTWRELLEKFSEGLLQETSSNHRKEPLKVTLKESLNDSNQTI